MSTDFPRKRRKTKHKDEGLGHTTSTGTVSHQPKVIPTPDDCVIYHSNPSNTAPLQLSPSSKAPVLQNNSSLLTSKKVQALSSTKSTPINSTKTVKAPTSNGSSLGKPSNKEVPANNVTQSALRMQ